MELNNYELININAGSTSISATMLNAIARCITVVYSFGRAVGTGIRYVISGKRC